MTKNYDQDFGPGGVYAWPGNLEEAEKVTERAPEAESSSYLLNDRFISLYSGDAQWLGKEGAKLLRVAEAERRKLFKDAMDWPMPCLVTSAVYFTLSRDVDLYTPWTRDWMVETFWHNFFWLFLFFDEPLVDMFRRNGWNKVYRSELRDGFQHALREWCSQLSPQLLWRGDKAKPWAVHKVKNQPIYREDFLRCLKVVEVDQTDAELAVNKIFELETLEPLYDLFSND